MRVELFAQTGQSRSKNANSQRTINFVPLLDPGSKNVKELVGSPGLTLLTTIATSVCRGMNEFRDVGYAVYGNKFYSITSGYVATERGTLNSSTGPVTFACNGLQVAVCDGSTYYIYTIATAAFAQVSDADFPGAGSIDYIASFGVFNEPGTQKLWLTGQLNFSTIDGFDFGSGEAHPDLIVRVFVETSTLYVMGTRTIEPWYVTGDADFPLSPISGGTIERGLLAKMSVAKDDNAIIFLGDDRVVYRLSGSSIARISSAQVEKSISDMSDPTDAEGWTYSLEDSRYYVLTFPTDTITWVYDFSTGLWHERDSHLLGRWRAAWHMRLGNKEVVGDYANGKLYKIDPTKYTEDGGTYISSHIFPAIHSEQRIPHNHFEVDIQAGVGLVSGQGSDPIMLLSWSDDGGHTWSNELDMKMGKIGEYKQRCEQRRLGSSLDRRYKISCSEPVKRVVTGAYLNGRGA